MAIDDPFQLPPLPPDAPPNHEEVPEPNPPEAQLCATQPAPQFAPFTSFATTNPDPQSLHPCPAMCPETR